MVFPEPIPFSFLSIPFEIHYITIIRWQWWKCKYWIDTAM